MPVPNVMSLATFKKKFWGQRAQDANIRSQEGHCYWCDEKAKELIAKYWHGFCSIKCWKAYRDNRLGK